MAKREVYSSIRRTCTPWNLPKASSILRPSFHHSTSSGKSPSVTVQMTRSLLPRVKFLGKENLSTRGDTTGMNAKKKEIGAVKCEKTSQTEKSKAFSFRLFHHIFARFQCVQWCNHNDSSAVQLECSCASSDVKKWFVLYNRVVVRLAFSFLEKMPENLWCGDLSKFSVFSTLNPQHLRMLRDSRVIFRHTSEVGVVLGPQIVDSQHGLVLSDVGDADTTSRLGLRQEQLIMSIPFECQREVAVRHRAQHRHPLSQP